MNVIYLQVFVSLALVASSVLLFLYSVKQADQEHADRLALLPIESEAEPARDAREGASTAPPPEPPRT